MLKYDQSSGREADLPPKGPQTQSATRQGQETTTMMMIMDMVIMIMMMMMVMMTMMTMMNVMCFVHPNDLKQGWHKEACKL